MTSTAKSDSVGLTPKILFSTILHDKGWSARIDGRQADIQIVGFGMRGLLMDGGPQEVELQFRPRFLTAEAVFHRLLLAFM
jgi:uncharacterized membrane protein YfhO